MDSIQVAQSLVEKASLSAGDIAMIAVAVVSTILLGVLTGVSTYLGLVQRLRREVISDIREEKDELMEKVRKATKRQDDSISAVVSEQKRSLEVARENMSKLLIPVSHYDTGLAAEIDAGFSSTRTALERLTRRLELISLAAEDATLWWFEQHGQASDIEYLRAFKEAEHQVPLEQRALAAKAIRSIAKRSQK